MDKRRYFRGGLCHGIFAADAAVCADNTAEDDGMFQLNLFVDYDSLEKERRIQRAMIEVRQKYGASAIFKGMNLLEGATTLERNGQIGGHRK